MSSGFERRGTNQQGNSESSRLRRRDNPNPPETSAQHLSRTRDRNTRFLRRATAPDEASTQHQREPQGISPEARLALGAAAGSVAVLAGTVAGVFPGESSWETVLKAASLSVAAGAFNASMQPLLQHDVPTPPDEAPSDYSQWLQRHHANKDLMHENSQDRQSLSHESRAFARGALAGVVGMTARSYIERGTHPEATDLLLGGTTGGIVGVMASGPYERDIQVEEDSRSIRRGNSEDRERIRQRNRQMYQHEQRLRSVASEIGMSVPYADIQEWRLFITETGTKISEREKRELSQKEKNMLTDIAERGTTDLISDGDRNDPRYEELMTKILERWQRAKARERRANKVRRILDQGLG